MSVCYSNYWRTWSRVLEAKNGEFIELNLTHVNGDWTAVKNETIRKHSTQRNAKDIEQEHLPYAAKQALVAVVGESLATRLLTHNYMSEIDWERHPYIVNGGVSFNELRSKAYA